MQNIQIDQLLPHPKNPRIFPRVELLEQLTARLKEAKVFDEAHALLVRPFEGKFQIISGHTRARAARAAGRETVPCHVREMDDTTAYMMLLTCNDQSELNRLERGKHALDSGIAQDVYCKIIGVAQQTVSDLIRAAKVVKHVTHSTNGMCTGAPVHIDFNEYVTHLIEVHPAPQWLWSAIVQAMVEA